MGNPRKLVLFLVGVYFYQIHAADKYTDENRPYEFGFTIEGEQHRHEKKDENGIIMGEFGFITADGVYHVTVYATDENGNFKILSMKNIRVKPYPTSPGAEVKQSNSLKSTASHKDSVPESTIKERVIKKPVASPVKSCSHCLLPTTTTTTTTISPAISKVSAVSNNKSPENYNFIEDNNNSSNKNPILSQNVGYQQKDYNSRTQQSNSHTVSQNYPQEQKNNTNDLKGNSEDLSLQNFGNRQKQHSKPTLPQSYPQTTINNQNYPQQHVLPNKPVPTINPNREQYIIPQNGPLVTERQIPTTDGGQNSPDPSEDFNIDQRFNQDFHPTSTNLQEPINKDNYVPNLALPQNNQADNVAKNYDQNNLNNKNIYPQEQNYEQGSKINNPNKLNSSPPTTISQTMQPYNVNKQTVSAVRKGDRSPKSFGDFIQQSVEPKEIASTGPNLYRPSLPEISKLSGKPVLLAAQMQIVEKNTNIYNKNPGESDGLPEGITMDDVTNLLYTFNYTVGFHGHHEKGYLNGAKQGYYYVTGRNGVRTRVDYVADEKGFHPKITQEILDIVSDEVPKPETEKDEKYGLKGYEFKWLYFPLDSKSI